VTAVVGEAVGGDRQRRWWLAVVAAALFFFFSLSLCFSFSFFFRFSVPSLFCFLSSLLLSFSLVSLLYFFVCSAPHVFIGKNKGGTWLGRPLCRRPSTAPPKRGKFFFWASGVGRRLFEREMVVENRERKIFFFPCFARTGEEENPPCRSKWHRLGLFLFFSVNSA
jgi:hypothetical protein